MNITNAIFIFQLFREGCKEWTFAGRTPYEAVERAVEAMDMTTRDNAPMRLAVWFQAHIMGEGEAAVAYNLLNKKQVRHAIPYHIVSGVLRAKKLPDGQTPDMVVSHVDGRVQHRIDKVTGNKRDDWSSAGGDNGARGY